MLRVLLTLLLIGSANAQPKEATVKVCRAWYVETVDGVTEGRNSYGTGFGVAHGEGYTIIMTNGHVCPDDDVRTSIITQDRVEIPAEVIATVPEDDRSEKGDLAILKVWKKLPIIKLADSEPKKDETVFQWGYPGAGRLSKLEGPWIGGQDFQYADYLCLPGCSGSAVCCKDKLVGVCFAVSHLKDAAGKTVRDDKGNPVFRPPTFVVSLKDVEKFLIHHIPKEMGYTVEKGPMPRHIPRGSDRK